MRYFISPNAITPVAENFNAGQLLDLLDIYKKIDYSPEIIAELKRWLDDPYTMFKHPNKEEHLFRGAKVTRYLHSIPFENVVGYSSSMGNSPDRDYVSVWSIFQNNGRLYANIHGLKREIVNSRFRKQIIDDLLKEI